ncbi:MAG: OmpA family protein [Pelosinus sp.]|nr:OmpA family protein [Pelosinus sp.]
MARNKHHAEHHEEHADETWLVPYSDILTLLLALFIVLFASSQVDQKKFDQMRQSFSMAFSTGSPALLDSMKSVQQSQESSTSMNNDQQMKEQAYTQESAQLSEVKRQIDKYIMDNGLVGDLQTILTDEGLMIRIKENALFPSGSAALLPESRRFGTQIAKMLLPLSQKVVVSGHTDNMPINTYEFPSNWDLSAKRAVNFMKLLLAQENLQPERFSAIGYGEYRPLTANDSEESRAKNRRVEIMVVRNYKM